ncbi:hypothetical protein ACHQM5_012262 [Ranunculus cassubicifolius]
MANSNGNGGSVHGEVVLFPFMAQGHLNPFLDLARHLSYRLPSSITITIVSTPANTLKLRPRFLSYPTIRFADLSAFPNTVENTDALTSLTAISHFYRQAETLLQQPFKELLSNIIQSNGGKPPICIISDMFLGFTVDVAHSVGSHHVPLYTSGPYAMSIYNSIWTHFPHLNCPGNDEDDVIPLPDLPHIVVRRNQLSENMKMADPAKNPACLYTKRQAEYCGRADGSLWNTVEVLEKKSLEDWEKSSKKPVWAIGPLLPSSKQEYERGGKNPIISPEMCMEWLDQQAENSVVYVSFGSQNSVPIPQMMELAKGLELSEKPFIWVLRNPTGADVNEEFNPEWLPEKFEDRMMDSKRGLIVRNWAPQMQILSHKAVGAFLSHCGWNSVLESLSRGVPIIAWSLGSEQYYNAKLMDEELGVCIEVGRGYNAKMDSGDIAAKVKMVLDGEKGKEMRRKAEALSEEMMMAIGTDAGAKGSSVKALEDFVATLVSWAQE